MFRRFGPYHFARTRAAAANLNATVVGLEVSSVDTIYDWDSIAASGAEKITMFRDVDSANLPRSVLLARFREVFRKESPIAVFVLGWTYLGIAGLIAANDLKIPTVMMSESSSRDFSRVAIVEWIKKQIVRGCGAALVGGETHREYLVRLGLRKDSIHLGYDAVDNDYFEQESLKRRSSSRELENRYGLHKPFFLASSRFVPKKNLATLFRSYAHYRKMAGDSAWDLVCLGDGELRSSLEKIRTELNLQDCLHLPGFVQYDELPNYYALAKCFVHVSTCEQWGLVINEAMASGLPIIVSEPCGSAHELVHSGKNGWIVDPLDLDGIAARMLEVSMLSSDQLRLMSDCSRRIIQDWGPERFGRAFRSALEAAICTPIPKRSLFNRLVMRLALAKQ